MRVMRFLTLFLAACSSGLEPDIPPVTVRQERAPAPGLIDGAEVRGNLIVVQGHFTFRGGCRVLRGELRRGPGALTLDVQGDRSHGTCTEEWSEYDYEVTIGPVPAGTYKLSVVNGGTEYLGPRPIVLTTEVRVE